MQNIDNNISKRLPDGYDVIDTYQNVTEQAIVDNLFDYLGKVYYKTDHSSKGEKIRNSAISKYDKQLFKFINRKIGVFLAWAALFIAITIGGLLAFGILIGENQTKIVEQISTFSSQWNWSLTSVEALVYSVAAIICLFALIALYCLVMIFYWFFTRCSQRTRVKEKVSQWKNNYARFTSNLTKSGIKNAIQTSIPELVFDKATPMYDKRIYNLHNRIYSYSNIPQDAKKNEYKNLSSGFYKGYAFSLSYSAWEWFREAKVVSQVASKSEHAIGFSAKRSLKRFSDSICVLTIDTFSEPKLNFVLNNVEGTNIKLQNTVFNKVFTLAVNNPKLAYTVFTPYVQHTLSRCKTWSQSSKAIRQVIKEGTKIHVVFDGKKDFFDFEMLTNPEKNIAFISKEKYLRSSSYPTNKRKNLTIYAKNKYGSLDDTAALMVEYLLEETDILYTALEMGTCFPMNNSFKQYNNNIEKTLFNVLEEKKQSVSLDPIITQLNERIREVPQAEVNFNTKKPTFKPSTDFNTNSSNKSF